MPLMVLAQVLEEGRVPVPGQHHAGGSVRERHVGEPVHVRVKSVPRQSVREERGDDHSDDRGCRPSEEREERIGWHQDTQRHRARCPPGEGCAAERVGIQDPRVEGQAHVVRRLLVVLHMAISPVGLQAGDVPRGARDVELVDAEMLEVAVVDVLVGRHDAVQDCKAEDGPHGHLDARGPCARGDTGCLGEGVYGCCAQGPG
mmetsp:Transcript_67502/g.200687  ORF Transcript_67502/g.200687 Transcript_67502/m.200687 type:complete len:202 (-) Transcript_67502:306-911(-)